MISIIPNFLDKQSIDDMLLRTAFDDFKLVGYSPGVLTQVPYKPNNKTLFNDLLKLNYGNLQSVEMLLYPTGSFSPQHIDKESFDGGKQWIRTVIIICNDNYTGGDLFFSKLGLTLKPPAGTLVSFPAGKDSLLFTHGVNKITTGERISLVFRYCG